MGQKSLPQMSSHFDEVKAAVDALNLRQGELEIRCVTLSSLEIRCVTLYFDEVKAAVSCVTLSSLKELLLTTLSAWLRQQQDCPIVPLMFSLVISNPLGERNSLRIHKLSECFGV